MALERVWVFAEVLDGQPITAALELLTRARSLGGTVEAICLSPEAESAAAAAGPRAPPAAAPPRPAPPGAKPGRPRRGDLSQPGGRVGRRGAGRPRCHHRLRGHRPRLPRPPAP